MLRPIRLGTCWHWRPSQLCMCSARRSHELSRPTAKTWWADANPQSIGRVRWDLTASAVYRQARYHTEGGGASACARRLYHMPARSLRMRERASQPAAIPSPHCPIIIPAALCHFKECVFFPSWPARRLTRHARGLDCTAPTTAGPCAVDGAVRAGGCPTAWSRRGPLTLCGYSCLDA